MSTALSKSLSYASGVAAKAYERALIVKSPNSISGVFEGGSYPVGPLPGVGDWAAQSRYRERYDRLSSWVYAAVNSLCLQASGQPLCAGRVGKSRKSKNRPYLTKQLPRRLAKRLKSTAQNVETVDDHPLLSHLMQPNQYQSWQDLVYTFIANLNLTGWGYLIWEWSKKEDRLLVYALPTTWVRPNSTFTEFRVADPSKPLAAASNDKPLTRDNVAFCKLPNPRDPRLALAPVDSQGTAIRVDEQIQVSQESFFHNSIDPSVLIVIGKGPFHDSDGKPVLNGHQRAQLKAILAKSYQDTVNHGVPIIADGLIDDVKRLTSSQREMGWEKSELRIRSRILSAFCVPAYVLGEALPGSYAQAYITQSLFYDRVNTFLSMLSTLLTGVSRSAYDDESLEVWIEECEAVDPQLRQSLLLAMRNSGDISQDEIRSIAGFPPDEDRNESLIPPQVAAQITQLFAQVAAGALDPDQMMAVLEGMGLPGPLAKRIAGDADRKAAQQTAEALQQSAESLRQKPSEEELEEEAEEVAEKILRGLKYNSNQPRVADESRAEEYTFSPE